MSVNLQVDREIRHEINYGKVVAQDIILNDEERLMIMNISFVRNH